MTNLLDSPPLKSSWLSSLDRWIILGRTVLLLERLWLGLWPVGAIVALLLASILLGVLQSLPAVLHALIMIGSLVVVPLVIYRRLSGLRMPTGLEAINRLDHDLELPNRPLSMLTDTLAIKKHNPITVHLWNSDRLRTIKQVTHLRLRLPQPEVAAQDPWALRSIAMLILFIAAVGSWGEWSSRLTTGLWPAFGQSSTTVVTVDAWITPPAYTQLPPELLPRTGPGIESTFDDPINIPTGSTILAIVSGIVTPAQLIIADNQHNFIPLNDQQYQIEGLISNGTQIIIKTDKEILAQWPIHVIPDQAPQIHLEQPIKIFPRGVFSLTFQAEDDYGLQTISAIITPLMQQHQDQDPLILVLSSDQNSTHRTATSTSFHDLTPHAWAGQLVTLQLQATDHVGNQTYTEPLNFTLPERVFTHPVARDIVAQRRRLLHDGESVQNDVALSLDVVSRSPGRFHGDFMVFLGLRLVYKAAYKTILLGLSESYHASMANSVTS